MKAAAVDFWKNASLGVFLVAIGVVIAKGWAWSWILVVICGMSFVRALLVGHWRFAFHPLIWGVGIAWAIENPGIGLCGTLLVLCGASIVLSYFVGRIPRRVPPPPRRGGPEILDAEAVSSRPVPPEDERS